MACKHLPRNELATQNLDSVQLEENVLKLYRSDYMLTYACKARGRVVREGVVHEWLPALGFVHEYGWQFDVQTEREHHVLRNFHHLKQFVCRLLQSASQLYLSMTPCECLCRWLVDRQGSCNVAMS